MRVAVIIPAFDAEATLDIALASVAAQHRLPDEIVVADDGSVDATVACARAWADRLPLRVIATGTRGAGPAVARARAIEESTSELIALLDADDVWLPDHLEAMHDAYARTRDGLASADALAWIAELGTIGEPLSKGAPVPAAEKQLAWLLTENWLSVSALFSRDRYDAVGGFRPQFRGTEDWDLWIRMVRAGAEVVRPPRPTMLYRLSASALSSDDHMVAARALVIEAAAREGGPGERGALRIARRHNRAAASLVRAYECAHDRRRVAARLAGVRALRGIRPVALRGAAMAIAPQWVARRRARVRFDPAVWMRRYGA